MTTKPKARKYRLRRPLADEPGQPEFEQTVDATQDASSAASEKQIMQEPGDSTAAALGKIKTKGMSPKKAKRGKALDDMPSNDRPSAKTAIEEETDAIRREGLTGRQLRMARRLAVKHKLPATSDFEAVRLLRAKGIDPFQRSSMLELVVPTEGETTGIPSPIRGEGNAPKLPSTETVSPAERRAFEVSQIQRELAKRRRKKGLLLMLRMAIFILLPALICGFYFYSIATPMYSTKSSLVIQKGDGGTATPSLFGASTPLATQQDSIVVQEFLQSKEAMLRLDEDEGFRAQFTQDWIDPIQRLSEDASIEEAYKTYKRHVIISYDPTDGVVKLEVIAPDPLVAQQFNLALIRYAEEQVDNLSLRKRTSTVADAEAGLTKADTARREAQQDLLRLQQEANIADPTEKLATLRAQISQREFELQEKQLQLEALLENARPNQARVTATQADVVRLERLLTSLNADMLEASTGENSLIEKSLRIEMAKADLATRDLMLQEALSRLGTAQRDAESQARYLEEGVRPVASEDPSHPRKFENTLLSLLVFAGIYLMVSLTSSVLREQIAS